jgi:hypothetical protein
MEIVVVGEPKGFGPGRDKQWGGRDKVVDVWVSGWM